MYMLWFDFILHLNFTFLRFKLIIIHYQTSKQKKIKFKPRKILNHNIYTKNVDCHYNENYWYIPCWQVDRDTCRS